VVFLNKKDRKDGFVLKSIIGFALIFIAIGFVLSSSGCGGGGGGFDPVPSINPTVTNTPVPFPTDPAVVRVVVTTQNPPRPFGRVTADLFGTSESGETVILAQVTSNLDGNGAGTIDLQKSSTYDTKQVNTGNDGLQNLVWDGGQSPTPTNTPAPGTPTNTPIPGTTPTNTPDPSVPTPTNTPPPGSTPTFTPVPVDPPNPGTPSDFVTLPYDGEGICYNPNNQLIYVALSDGNINAYNLSGALVYSTTGYGGGLPPGYNGVAYNPITNQIGGNDSRGRLIIYNPDLSYVKRGIIPENCTDIQSKEGQWVIANDPMARLEFYSATFNDGDALSVSSTLGSGILSGTVGFNINSNNQYVCADDVSSKIYVINSDNSKYREISTTSFASVDNYYQYIFASAPPSILIYNNSNGSSAGSLSDTNGTGYIVIVDRTIYYTSVLQKKVRKVVF